MGIERADRHGDSRTQPDSLGDVGRQFAGLAVGSYGRHAEHLGHPREVGIESGEEFWPRQAAPLLVVHRLVPGRTNATQHPARFQIAGNEGGDEVGQFHPGGGRGEHLGSGSLAVQDLRPVPLAAVGATALGQVTVRALAGLVGNLSRFGVAGVILPEPGVGGQVLLQGRLHRQRHAVAIDGQGCGTGGVDPDADHVLGLETANLLGIGHRAADGGVKPFDIVGRILASEVRVFRIEQDPRLAARVVEDRGSNLASVGHVDN